MNMPALLAATLLLPSVLLAQDARKTDEKFVSLFDGKTLDGWKVENCDVEVQDGCIFLKGGNGWARTEKAYSDFVLELDWKALKREHYDSGVFIRAVSPAAGKSPWPERNQVNLRQDVVGNIEQYKGAVGRTDLVKPGKWNHFRLVVVGKTAELLINGKHAWKIDNLKPATGLIGLQCEVPGGGQFLFRNLRISER
ncbi:MAG: DUF1080 domain-containing protein [Thermoguttaceae bacterium]|jgi:hypothetical protein